MADQPTIHELSFRARAMLRAVAAGRAAISLSCEPDLFVDGLACCDQITARELAHAGLICPSQLGLVGQVVPAVLTAAGSAVIATEPCAA